MSIIKGVAANGSTNIPYPTVAGAIVAATYSHTFKSAPIEADIIEIGCLPQGCKLIDTIMVSDPLDAADKTISFDLVLLSGDFASNDNTRSQDAGILSGSVVGREGGIVRPTDPSAYRIPAGRRDRGVGLVISAAPGAGFTPGTVNITLLYNAS